MYIFLYKTFSNFLSFFIFLFFLIRFFMSKENLKSLRDKFVLYKTIKPKGKLVWINAVSIGEAKTAIIVTKEILKKNPRMKVLFSTSTISAYEVIKSENLRVSLIHTPIDIDFLIKRFLRIWNPSLVIFFESEIWPNVISNVHDKNIKFLICNGRISKKSFKKLKKNFFFSKDIFKKINFCQAQDHDSYLRFKSLGVNKVKINGNLKFLSEKPKINKRDFTNLKTKLKSRKVVTLFSSHEGEEKLFINCAKLLQKKFTNLFFIIIPRHINRCNSIHYLIKKNKLNSLLRSDSSNLKKEDNFLIVDTFGELGLFFKLSYLAIVGGSLVKKGGHNPIEAESFNCPLICGPNMQNFSEIEEKMRKNKAGLFLKNYNDLEKKISFLLENPKIIKLIVNNFKKLCKFEKSRSIMTLKEIQNFIDDFKST